jgi:hypothetical protein
MLLMASMILASSGWVSAPSCPAAFNSVNTTIGAITSSSELTVCASKALFIKGSTGSLSLVLGSGSNSSPACLVYPNGLNPDLTYNLLATGHVGCWSLYPPNQAITIVNIGKPSQTKLQAALKSFRPTTPKIFRKPNTAILVGTKVLFSTSASSEVIKTKMLNLAAQVRFIPIAYKWGFRSGTRQALTSKIAKPTFIPLQQGASLAELSVNYSVEYTFIGLTPWIRVTPNLLLNALPLNFVVGAITPNPSLEPPRLVQEPCSFGSTDWRC